MDIITGFEPVVGGSNPSGDTIRAWLNRQSSSLLRRRLEVRFLPRGQERKAKHSDLGRSVLLFHSVPSSHESTKGGSQTHEKSGVHWEVIRGCWGVNPAPLRRLGARSKVLSPSRCSKISAGEWPSLSATPLDDLPEIIESQQGFVSPDEPSDCGNYRPQPRRIVPLSLDILYIPHTALSVNIYSSPSISGLE